MNIYARYFNQEVLVYSLDELIDFLVSIPEIDVTDEMVSDIANYVNGDMPYPKRYKIRPRVYFILIKNTAQSMEEFKMNKKATMVPTLENNAKAQRANELMVERYGWYRGEITFKRVLPIPGTMKFQYQDTFFSAFVKARNAMECYNRIVNYIKQREDVDLRSQFPSAKGSSFFFEYCGETLPNT